MFAKCSTCLLYTSVSQYSPVVAYQPLADGSAYMAVQGEDHTEIYQVFQEATLEQHLYNIDSVYTCLAWENEKLWAVHPGENAIVLLEEGKQIQKATYAYASSAWPVSYTHLICAHL